MGDVVVLAKEVSACLTCSACEDDLPEDTTQVTTREEYTTRPIVALKAWFYNLSAFCHMQLRGDIFALPSPKCGATVFTFTVSAPIRHTPVFS